MQMSLPLLVQRSEIFDIRIRGRILQNSADTPTSPPYFPPYPEVIMHCLHVS